MIRNGENFRFSSGRKFDANCRIIGLRTDTLEAFGGYDDVIGSEEWTIAERKELADYMIERWTAFRESGGGEL